MKFVPAAALAAFAASTALAGAAAAQMRGPNPDLNRDGKVTLAEFKTSQADAMMGRLDADRNGRITRAEAKLMADRAKAMGRPEAGRRLDEMFARMDADGDGALTRGEIEGGAAPRFKTADANGDGWLSKGELASLRQPGTRAD
jgi:Ca2+-binding EF-hand superfamily protein